MRRFWIAAYLGLGVAAAACGSANDSGVFAGGGKGGSGGIAGGAANGGAAGNGVGGGIGGGVGGAIAGAGGVGAVGGSAGDGGPIGCSVPGDCPPGRFCDAASGQCQSGCDDDSDCSAPTPHCDSATHGCRECAFDTDCAPGNVCSAGVCTPGCSSAQPCPNAGETCCGSVCYDLSSDLNNCGTCGAPCPTLPNAASTCTAGQCVMAGCAVGFADCNSDPTDGCEWNAATSGPCACTPGSTQSCYFGPAGTENVGICKAGTQTCAANGLGYGACMGQVLPATEICANGIDEDCNGAVDDVKDDDGDGWTECQGDCCDTVAQCSKPANVNPGAFEFVGNGVDDDCDPTTSDTTAPTACSTSPKFTGVTAADVARAIDLCQFTTQNPPLDQKKWGVITAQFLLANGATPNATQLSNMQNYQAAVLANYGTGGIVPKNGATMAGISSGRMRDQNDPGYVDPNAGTDFGSYSQPPAAYLAAHGGALPASKGCTGNCPSGSGANDSINVRLTIRVPTNALSFSYQFRFFSSEYWTYQCTVYNDFYLALLTTGAAGIPADKNISFDSLNNPVSVNNGFYDLCVPKGCNTCPAGTSELQGTGMQVNGTGGGTKWLTTTAPIVPGETMIIEFMIFDVSDGILDSLSILDNFTWKIDPSGVGTVD